MGLRDGQRRVEIKPGAFVWMTDKEADALEGARSRKPSPTRVETATVEPTEQAVMPKARKGAQPQSAPAHEPKV